MSSADTVVMDDVVVLGNAVPDEISDNRFTVCTAGYSPKYGLLRIYPVPPRAPMKRWNVVQIPLERNPKDTREESWKIQGSRQEWDDLHRKIRVHKELTRKEWMALLETLHSKYGVSCVQDLNEQKLSLGVIKPEIQGYRFEERPRYDPSVQMTLDSVQQFLTINNYAEQPRITYRCGAGCKSKKPHDQQLIEWGAYEWMRNSPNEKHKLWENLRLNDPEWDISFLVGNQSLYRTAFMIISVFRFKRT
ncbi:MAG: hypothetical protein ACREBU_04485 [Nitrososphaera sp.]